MEMGTGKFQLQVYTCGNYQHNVVGKFQSRAMTTILSSLDNDHLNLNRSNALADKQRNSEHLKLCHISEIFNPTQKAIFIGTWIRHDPVRIFGILTSMLPVATRRNACSRRSSERLHHSSLFNTSK